MRGFLVLVIVAALVYGCMGQYPQHDALNAPRDRAWERL